MCLRSLGSGFDKAHGRCPAVLRELGVSSLTPLGCGSQGCVYPAGRGQVLKVTNSMREAIVALYLRELRHRLPPFMPVVHGAVKLPSACFDPGEDASLYAVRMERLANVPRPLRLERALFALESAQPALGAHFSSVLARELAVGGDEEVRLWIRSAADAMRWLERMGMSGQDLGPENWGLRGQQLVLRDLGMVFPDDATYDKHSRALRGRG